MKKVLIICPFTPSKKGAGVAYSQNFIEELSKNNRVDLFYYSYKDDEPFQGGENVTILRNKRIGLIHKIAGAVSLPFLFPLFSSRFSWTDYFFLRRIVNEGNYDYLYFDFSQTFCYAFLLKHDHKILMSHDIIYQRYQRKNNIFLPWVKHSEKILLKHGTVFTFSLKDVQIINREYNYDSYSTNFFLNKNVLSATPSSIEDYFVFFASWGRYDNDESLNWFIDNIYSRYNLSCKILVIGGGLSTEQKFKLRKFNIDYLGFVDNPYNIIANAKALLSPLHYGAGVKVKCIESLACGTPVIGTPIAFEGISEEYGRYMISADTPEDYVEAMNSINFSVKDKKEFKDFFINTYKDKSIISYIQK